MHRRCQKAAAGEQPDDQRVGVPHVPRSALVSSPDQGRNGGHEVEETLRQERVARESSRAVDGLAEVRDHAVAPATHLGAKDPEPSRPAAPDRSLGDDTPAPGHHETGSASSRSRTGPPGPVPRAPRGRDRRRAGVRVGPPRPRTRARSAGPSDLRRREGASRDRHRVWTGRARETLAAIVASSRPVRIRDGTDRPAANYRARITASRADPPSRATRRRAPPRGRERRGRSWGRDAPRRSAP